MLHERRKIGGAGDLRGYGARNTILNVGALVEEEEVDSGEADERVDVEEENAVEEGNVRH